MKQCIIKSIVLITLLLPILAQANVKQFYNSNFESVIKPIQRHAQSQSIKSKAEIMRLVKSQYNAEVLKIKLDRQNNVYRVRVLLPNGKVRAITINALR